MAQKARGLRITDDQRIRLQRCADAPATLHRVWRRCHIVLLLAEGKSMRDVAARVGVARRTVELWRNRYEAEGLERLMDEKSNLRR